MSCYYKALLFGWVALSDCMTDFFHVCAVESYEQKFLPSF